MTGEIINLRTTNWCVAPAPTRAWAGAVYPDLEPDKAFDRLWATVAHICRLDDDDPVAAWRERMATLERSATALTERRFDAIHLHGPGTDLTVGLFPSSMWHAAELTTVDGLPHFPNIPSEEMFTTPDPLRADGHVSATLPLELFGSIIRGLHVEFEGGRGRRSTPTRKPRRCGRPRRRTTAPTVSASSRWSTAPAASALSRPSSSTP